MKRLLFLSLIFSLLAFKAYAEEDVNYGYINPELIVLEGDEDASADVSLTPPAMLNESNLPEKFDARDNGIIHDGGIGQYTDSTCWSFASTLAMETALGGKVDLSEQHAKYASSNTGNNIYGYNRTPSSGGNFFMYTAYASAWRGPVLEADDPYSYGDETRDYQTVTAAKPVAYHLQGTVEIPNPASSPAEITAEQRRAHVNEVKKYVYQYGCCFSSVYWSLTYYNSETEAYYNPNGNIKSNHAVCIIGWDDNYPKENFATQPENDGAFIIKNSQSLTGFYHYLSYEDAYAGWDAGAVTSVEDKYNYGELYTHEYFQPGATLNSSSNSAKTTNAFTSRHDGEYVSAVGIVTKARNLDYKVYISNTADGLEPTESEYTLCASGNLEMPGFYTIKLDTPYILGNAGTKYCVRVVYSSDSDFQIPLEYATGTITDTHAEPGQSFFSVGSSNYDIGEKYNANLYVKAYTDADYKVEFNTDSVRFSINGSEGKDAESITAGLNDEITFDFSDTTGSFYINSQKYEPGTKITLKVTEDLNVSEEKIAEIKTGDMTLNSYRMTSDTCTLTVTPEFTGEKTVIAAFYTSNMLVGVKSAKVNENVSFSITADITEEPDSVKILTIDSLDSLSTDLDALRMDF